MGFHIFKKKKDEHTINNGQDRKDSIERDSIEKEDKDTQEGNNTQEGSSATNRSDIQENGNSSNRFTFMVEAVAQIPNEQGVAVRGVVHGKCHVKDEIYVLHPGRKITKATIDEISLQGVRADYAEDQEADLRIDAIKNKDDMQIFSVVTSIAPQVKIDVNTAIENPYLLGLIQEFKKGCRNVDFMNIFAFELAHSNFITPLKIDGEEERLEDGKVRLKKGATMGFLQVKDPVKEGKYLFPLFTDWKELSQWKILEDQQPRTMIFTFPNAVEMVKNNVEGLLINGFGGAPVVIPKEMIQRITSLDAYQKEFFQNKTSPTVNQVRIKKGTKFIVGYPNETPEIRGITDAMKEYAVKHEAVRRIDFLLKQTEDGQQTYHCVVDCDEEQREEIFRNLFQVAEPYFKNIKLMDFELYTKTTLKESIIKDHAPLYQR